MNLEDKWRAEFEDNEWPSIEMKWSFPLGSHHKKLIKETAEGIYLSARRKAQEEIDSKLDEKELTMFHILMRNEISAEMKRLENHSARPKNYLQELEILKGKLK